VAVWRIIQGRLAQKTQFLWAEKKRFAMKKWRRLNRMAHIMMFGVHTLVAYVLDQYSWRQFQQFSDTIDFLTLIHP
jgi:hypothetical protein